MSLHLQKGDYTPFATITPPAYLKKLAIFTQGELTEFKEMYDRDELEEAFINRFNITSKQALDIAKALLNYSIAEIVWENQHRIK